MKIKRIGVFETNSSSTHSLVYSNDTSGYYPHGKKLAVKWADTDDDYNYTTLQEKVSYLVSHIARKYMYNVYKYDDLIEEIRDDYEFQAIEKYLKNINNSGGYEIVFPPCKDREEEEWDWLININHQLIENNLEDVLDDLLEPETLDDKISEVLSPGNFIQIGHD